MRSRWTIWLACALATASAICAPIRSTSGRAHAGRGIGWSSESPVDELHHEIRETVLGAST